MSKLPNLLIFLCSFFLFGHAQAETHKCMTTDGKISYQDVPCQGQDKRISATATSDAVSPLTRGEKQKRILEQALKEANQARSAPPIVLFSASDRVVKKTCKPRVGMSGNAVEACVERGVAYFKEMGSYPTLQSAPNTGRRAEDVACERCNRTTTAF